MDEIIKKKVGLPLIIFFGVIYLCFTWVNTKDKLDRKAIQIAKSAAAMIHTSDLQKLKVQASDIHTAEYQYLNGDLRSLVNANQNPQVRFAYLYTLKNDKLYFMVGGESVGSRDYSPPGQEFTEAEKAYYDSFNEDKTIITNAVKDRWGKWVSVLVPIKDPVTQKIIAVFGMNFDAQGWYSNIIYQMTQASILLILTLIVFFGYLKIKLNNKLLNNELQRVKKIKNQLNRSENRFKEIIDNVQDILYQADLNGNFLEISSNSVNVFGYHRLELIGAPSTILYANPEERKMVLNIMGEAGECNDVQVTFKTKENELLHVSLTAKWMFDENNNPSYINGIMRNITERKKIEEKLAKSENLLHTIFENQPECIKIVDATGNLILMNQIGLEMIEADSMEQVEGACVFDLIEPNYKEAFINLHKQVIKGNHEKLEFEIVGLKGTKRWVETVAVPMMLDGEMVHLGLTRDISKRKIADERLSEAQRIGRLGSFDLSLATGIYKLSEISKEILGIDESYVTDMEGWMKLVHPDSIDKVIQYRQIVISQNIDTELAYKIIRPNDGAERWVETTARAYTDQLGNPYRVAGLLRDITESKLAAERLEKSEQFLKESQKVGRIGSYEIDLNTEVWQTSEGINLIFGIDNNSIKNLDDYKTFIHPDYKKEIEEYFYDVIAQKKKFSKQYKIIRRNDGAERWIHGRGLLIFDENGDPIKMTGAIQDITAQKKFESELIIAKEKAEESERLKTAFLANISHEMRTPLNGILGMNRLLMDTNLNTEQLELTNAISFSGENLVSIVNDILDLSKINAGKLTFEQVNFDLEGLVRHVIYNFRPMLKPNTRLEFDMDSNIPKVLVGDSLRLKQIFNNLVGNAVKFTHQGELRIAISYEKTLSGIVLLAAVKDTGIGIASDKVDEIFMSFTQAEGNITRKYGGTGLGLSITKHLIELQGGSITVESELGKGSTFSFRLPLGIGNDGDVAVKKAQSKWDSKTLEGLRILLAEDQEVNQKLVTKLVQKAGGHIVVAENGQVAVDQLKDDSNFDLVLMDLQMPILDGFSATDRIRNDLKLNIPIIAMTASAMMGEADKCLSRGMNGYLSKPFEFQKFFEIVQQFVEKADENKNPEPIQKNDVTKKQFYNLSWLEELGDPDYSEEIVLTYLETVPVLLDNVRESAKEGNWEEVYEKTHKAKSPVGLFQETSLYELLLKIETAAQKKTNLTECLLWIDEAILLSKEIEEQLKLDLNKIKASSVERK
ncbi:PAS domain S-box protein [Flavobacterium gilvum]|uniref:Sensory/regulatory protein RpfC n=1 Tax=Flavobacterium gilvum TaxID=1492737 RepID=A0AAC9N4V9_9FLAO|nr:PAS domain S-box protein [Flavobacterium gilvum]AOW08831.1 hypothetical protein EM308_04550 [Flavobacterium gilvum]KFC61206.1 histidine kinase [Flavobacterium gilvum]